MKKTLEELQKIPGVGSSLARDLYDLGVRTIADLKELDPEDLFEKLCRLRKKRIDRCVLYVFRLAVYFSREKEPKGELLKWWNWKDKKIS